MMNISNFALKLKIKICLVKSSMSGHLDVCKGSMKNTSQNSKRAKCSIFLRSFL